MKCIILDNLSAGKYEDLIDYCIQESDSFMLVYVHYQMYPLTHISNEIKTGLKPFQIKKRTNPSWPGTPKTYCPNTKYEIVFYSCTPEVKRELMKVNNIYEWARPQMPQDLAFFRNNKCWLFTVGHEGYAGIIDPTFNDIDFLKRIEVFSEDKLEEIPLTSAQQFYEDL